MKRAKGLIALVLALVMCVALFGCGSKSTTGTTTGDTATGGTLNIHIETGVESMDPQEATDGTSFEVIADITDGLMQMDANGSPVAAMAESYEVSDDGLTYTFHIRQGATWSSTGDPVKAQDFVFGWQRAVDPDVASEYSYMLSDIGQVKNAADIIAGKMDKSELGVTAKDDNTLVVELNAPVSYFLSLMYFPTFYPIEQSFYESCGDTFATSPETLQSNGAFVMTSYEPSATSFTLVKNDNYWDAGRVQLAGLNYQLIQDSQQALLSYQTGDLDTIILSGDQVDQVKDDPEFTAVNAGYLWYLSPNISAVPALANLNMRMAMSLAIDRQTMVESVVKDGSAAATFAVPDQLATGPDGQDFRATAKDYTADETCTFDATKAQEYLAKAEQELGQTSFTFEMIVDDDDQPKQVATYLQQQIQSVLPDVTITLRTEPKKQRVKDMQDGTYELGLTRWGPDYADPMTYLGMWKTGNSNNYGLWSNSDYDALLDESTTGDLAGDPAGRWAALHQAEEIVMTNAVIIPLYEKCNATMIKSNVTNIEFHPIALNRVYKDAVKAAQ
ncbi:MAG: peptide ABC transporter substrate-binding protein [Oscillospiraceae bacterium]|nr:peptide ABC transporter substrate-binding protein [Oscillospiraceae bacterium]